MAEVERLMRGAAVVSPIRPVLRVPFVAVAVVVVGIVLMARGSTEGTTFALEGTDAQPGASANVVISATPAGLKILLDTEGLPGAPDGYMYEAWVGDDTIGVSAGTFHLRGGDGPIELWAGVTGPEFTADLSGTGTLVVSGSVDRLTATQSGFGTLELGGLAARDVIARLEGTGDVNVRATSTLDATLTGTGSIVYSGSPSVTTHDPGVGSVTPG